MRIGWVGFHVEGLQALRGVLDAGYRLEGVITLKPEAAAKRSGAADYRSISDEFGVPYFEVSNINDDCSLQLLSSLALDLAFVIGWSQIVRPQALSLVKLGMIGSHASLLPENRGRAPVNWALIRGAGETGNTLIWLADGVDAGDIIDQTRIPVTTYDTCASIYGKVASSNRTMILRALEKLKAGERPGKPQQHTSDVLLPGRKPKDGRLDWRWPGIEVYNFVRGITKPYPGAFGWLDGTRWIIWKSALLPLDSTQSEPGAVIGPVVSPEPGACGQMVACGQGGIVLLELENDSGDVLSGSALSDQPWRGKVWTNE